MRKILRLTVPAVIVLLTLVLSALWATPALADDGTPPTTAPAGVSAPASAAPSSTDAAPAPAAAAPADVSAPASAAPSSADPAPAPAAAAPADVSAPASNTASNPASLLAQVPKGTRFVVTDASGKAISLASQKAAQAVVKGDPTWCPTGVNPGGTGCSNPQSSFNALLGYMSNKTVAGTIWIETSYDSSIGDSGGVNIDGSLLAGMTQNYALTLKGGWNGSLGTLAAITGASTFNVPLSINWNAAVTLSDIVITGLSDAGSTALTITTPANITLTRVNVNTNAGKGAKVDNHSGTGAVTVSNSNFSSNASGDGLDISSKGAITLNTLIANGNISGTGANLDNTSGTGTVTVNNSQFNNDYDYGLLVASHGAITINGLTTDTDAQGTGSGAFITNHFTGVTAGVTLTGSNIFDSNYQSGILIYSNGAIKANGLEASDNGGWGVDLDNSTAATPQAITLAGVNTFDNNWWGLQAYSKGAITVNQITADGNTKGAGAWLDNCNFTSNTCGITGSVGGVTLTGSNQFENNSNGSGLVIYSVGAITANQLTANNNGSNLSSGGDGVYLNNCLYDSNNHWCTLSTGQPVTLTGTNTFNSNYFHGLYVTSLGQITTNNLNANGNGTSNSFGAGVWLENDNLNSKNYFFGGVTLLGNNNFTNNYYDGLDVLAMGAITANNITATGNGLSVPTADQSRSGVGAWLLTYSNLGNVTLTGNNVFTENHSSNIWTGTNPYNNTLGGLTIMSYGGIQVNNVTANGDLTAAGAYLDNCQLNSGDCQIYGTAAITLTGTNTFNNNFLDGLDAYSYGSITASNLNASGNGTSSTSGMGVSLNNDYANYKSVNSTGIITLTGVNEFNYNWSGGLNALSKGAIRLTDVDAIGNTGNGAYLNNTSGPIAAGVTLININVFSENSSNGLEVHTNGAITTSNLVANSNGGHGAWLDNCGYNGTSCTTLTIAPVTVSVNNQFKDNNSGGLAVFSNGLITLNNIIASNNGGPGVWVDNRNSPTFQGVTITGTNLFDANSSAGLFVFTRGPVTANNLSSTNNGYGDSATGYGVDIENYTATTAQPVTLTGTNFIGFNNLTGLWLLTNGAVSINDLSANNNGDMGAYILNCGWSTTNTACTSAGIKTPQNVTFTGYVNVDGNFHTGMNVWTYGTISLANVSANNNGQSKVSGGGVYLDNCEYNDLNSNACDATLPRAVTLTGNNSFDNNYTYGLVVNSLGAITVNNANADNNGDNNGNDGMGLWNSFPGAVGGVSVINTLTSWPDFSNNGGNGLEVYSRGTITVMDLDAQSNGADGVYLNNLSNTTGTAAVNLGTSRANWSNWLSYNYNSGVEVYSNGLVTLSNLDAENNGHYVGDTGDPNTSYRSLGYGVWVNNSNSSLSQGVTLNGTWNGFKNNYLSGLEIYTKGVVTTNHIDADNNGYNTAGETTVYGYGVLINNCGYTTQCTILTPKTITLNGYNNFNNNYSGGLYVYSNGAITANTVNSNNNLAGSGASFINNANPAAPQSVTLNALNGTSNFYGNADSGLYVQSFGLVTLNSVNADTNKVDGIHVDNATGALASQLKGVTILGYADVYNNPGYGLFINSLGPISINTIDADNNNGIGAYINNSSGNPGTGVTFTGVIHTTNSKNEGMDVLSRGAITFNNLTDAWIAYNGSYGWNLDNNYPGAVGGITMTIAVNQNIDFTDNGGYGLWAQSLGAITTNNLDANGNNGFGATLDNAFTGAVATATITINDPSTTDNYFSNNSGGDGLEVLSNRAITVSNLTANGNGVDGAYLDNQWPGAVGGITLTGTNVFENNSNIGLEAFSKGAISMNNVNSNWNSKGGASLDNHGLGTPQSVTMTGMNYFNGNNDGNNTTHNEFGLQILSDGAITLYNIMANWNDGFGASLNNTTSTSTPRAAITLYGINTFNDNTFDGLDMLSNGAVTLNSLTADNNGGEGLNVQTQGSITVACGSITSNGSYGWVFNTPGTITLKGVWVFGNHGGDTDKISGTLVNVRTCP